MSEGVYAGGAMAIEQPRTLPDVVYLSDADAHRTTAPNIRGPATLVVPRSFPA